MLAAFPFHAGDVHLLADLLSWIGDLGGCKSHDALLVADADVQWSSVVALRDLAVQSFGTVHLVTNEVHVDGWIPGSNSLWLAAARWAMAHERPFWFHEPDCIPVKAGWLDALESAWTTAGRPKYFGAVVKHEVHSLPNPYLEGCSIYHANAYGDTLATFDMSRSWTLACAPVTMPAAVNTPLVQHFWGEANLAPTFAETKTHDSSINTFTLDSIYPKTVVFHRNKDGTLVQLLRRKFKLFQKRDCPHELVVVIPFCKKDELLALDLVSWIVEMGLKLDRHCVLHFDGSVSMELVARITGLSNQAFSNVHHSRYPIPTHPYIGWPAACNFTFQRAVEFMERFGKNSWLWLEPDAIPVCRDWLTAIEDEYEIGGQPFMGTMIPGDGMGHMNGVAVYPWNTQEWAPCIMGFVAQPWDQASKPEVAPNAHKANHLIFHCRSVRNGRCVDEHGAPPKFNTMSERNSIIEPSVKVFHPVKHRDLIRFLRLSKR